MPTLRLAICLLTVTSLSACGLGETAAVASAEAKRAEQAQQQMQQLQQQIDQANAASQLRLETQLENQQ
jgi:type II secretory pathway pseudopilin PulG